jgi:membrane protease YdiL (CAAX protease family)
MSPRIKSSIEVFIGVALIFCYLWLITPLYSQWVKIFFAIPVFLFLIYSNYSNQESLGDIGFGLKNWNESFKILLVFTLIAIPVLYVVWQFFMPTNIFFYNNDLFWKRLVIYPLVVLCQGYIFLAFFFRRFRKIFFPYTNVAIFFSSLIFSAAHIPTPPLIILCFIAGIVWASVYHKYPNLFTITLFHSILGIFCSFVLLIYSEVGPNADPGKWSNDKDSVYGYIDTINHISPTKYKDNLMVKLNHKQNSIFVTGWVASEDTIEKIQLSFGGKLYPVNHGIERRDVATHYNNQNYLYSGFSADIPTSDFELGYYKLFLKVDLEDGIFYRSPGSRIWINLK